MILKWWCGENKVYYSIKPTTFHTFGYEYLEKIQGREAEFMKFSQKEKENAHLQMDPKWQKLEMKPTGPIGNGEKQHWNKPFVCLMVIRIARKFLWK